MRAARVLIIDDSKEVLDVLSKAFELRLNVIPLVAASVDEAEPLLKDGDFDLVISDFEMPGRHGGEVIQILSKENKSFPLIFFTASTDIPADLVSHGDFPFVVVGHKNYRELLAIASDFCVFSAR